MDLVRRIPTGSGAYDQNSIERRHGGNCRKHGDGPAPAHGLGMMECKKALTEAAGDLAKAEERCGSRAEPRRRGASRIAAEGVIGLYVAPDAKTRRWSR
jgi:hypothetical protein